MQKWKIVSVILVLLTVTKMYAQDDSYDSHVKQYISQYKDWAIEEQRRTGVPAAITLAQGIHETSAGSSELALNANNHFGIKCKKEWKGDTYSYTDDAPNECFRKYKSAFNSYKDHSDYLRSGKRYDALFRLPVTDYKGWAVGLKRCGYATNPKYSQILIRLVENYDLQQYTYEAMHEDENIAQNNIDDQRSAPAGEVIPKEDAPVTNNVKSTYEAPQRSGLKVNYTSKSDEPKKVIQQKNVGVTNNVKPPFGKIITVNGLKAFYASKGTMLLDEAVKNNIRYAKLLEINDLPDAPLEADMFIYLEKKNTKGNSETHLVKHGETLLQIAQQEGIQLKWLKFYNRIGGNEEISEGAIVQLQQLADVKPATHPKVVMNEPMHDEPFVGANPRAIPQGATRMRAGYIRKSDIEKESNEPLKKLVTEEKENNTQQETPISDNTAVNNEAPSANNIAEVKEPVVEAINTEKKEVAITETEKKTVVADDNIATKKAADTTTQIAKNNEEQKIEPVKETIKEETKIDTTVVVKKDAIKSEPIKETALTDKKIETVKEEVTAPLTEVAKTATTPTSTKEEPAKIVADTEKQKEIEITPAKEATQETIAKTDAVVAIKKEESKSSPVKEVVKETADKTTPVAADVNSTSVKNEAIQDPTVAEEASATKNTEAHTETTASIPESKNNTEEHKEATQPQDNAATEIKKPADFSVVNPSYDTTNNSAKKDNPEIKEQHTTSNDVAATAANTEKKVADATTKKVENYTTIPVAPLAGNNKTKKEDEETEEAPKNKFDRLKAKLDKVVYASDNIAENEKSDEQKVKKEEQENKPKAEETNKTKYYTVKKGDSFSSIIKENKITKHQLMTWNKLKKESVKIGQKLKVKP